VTTSWPEYGRITGPIVLIGFGSIGRGVLPLIERHFAYDHHRVCVIDPEPGDLTFLKQRGVRLLEQALTRDNYRALLGGLLAGEAGQGFVVNVSVDTDSLDLMKLCRELGALYIDTVVEPWPGFYFDMDQPLAARTNYALRERVRAERAANPGGTTAISCCGANPGMVSWFVKEALVNLARDLGHDVPAPRSRADWAKLMRDVGVKGVHIAERDTQYVHTPKPIGTFVNTWSVEGFIAESFQPAELGWGTHEKWFPDNGRRHDTGCRAAIYLDRRAGSPGFTAGVLRPARSTAFWSPTTRPFRSPTISPSAIRAIPSSGPPATMPTIPATMRCCRCTRPSAAVSCSRSTRSWTRPR